MKRAKAGLAAPSLFYLSQDDPVRKYSARRAQKYVHSCECVCKCQVHKEMRLFLHVCWNWFISHSNKICLMSYET